MNKLEEARSKINDVDKQMAALFEERMQAVEDVIAYKLEHHMDVLDASREQQVIEKNSQYINHSAYITYYKDFIQDVMKISRNYQKSRVYQDVIAYAGTKGAFSHIAAMQLFPNGNHTKYPTFEDVVEAVENGTAAYGVLPFENSYTGEVGENMDMLMEHEIYIDKMYDLKISQNLLGIKGAKLADIKQVYSKDQAISQSKKFLEGRNMELIPYPNTALAAEYIAQQKDPKKAAIASKETADIYGLDILAEDINTSSENTTRFIVISKTLKTEGNRVSIVFTVHHEAGALAKVMSIISDRGFNMESIHSRSIKDQPFAYYFYVEIVGNPASESMQELLQEMKNACESMKIVGAYNKESRDEK